MTARALKYLGSEGVKEACRRCRAAAGEPCRNYLGQCKPLCKERGTPAPKPEPVPADLFG